MQDYGRLTKALKDKFSGYDSATQAFKLLTLSRSSSESLDDYFLRIQILSDNMVPEQYLIAAAMKEPFFGSAENGNAYASANPGVVSLNPR